MTTIYYDPQDFDCELVAQADLGSCYDFDMFILVRHVPSGRLYYATDSGCSCPSPFEDIYGVADMTELTNAGWGKFDQALREWDGGTENAGAHDIRKAAAVALVAQVITDDPKVNRLQARTRINNKLTETFDALEDETSLQQALRAAIMVAASEVLDIVLDAADL